jgi:hypothetical protein
MPGKTWGKILQYISNALQVCQAESVFRRSGLEMSLLHPFHFVRSLQTDENVTRSMTHAGPRMISGSVIL